MTREFTVLHLFCGIGGDALGFQQAISEYKGMVGRFRTICGIDVDAEACWDFENLTGARAVQMDLFSRDDYIAFHGQPPDPDWREVTAIDLLEATKGEYPDVIFLSPPCKGFSGLLPKEKAESSKYQALNRLVIRGLALAIEAFSDDLPSVIMLENVPRITTRGELLLKQVKKLLKDHGYEFHEGYHDCGVIGGLAQRRKRYLLIARNREKMSAFIYRPRRRKVRAIGDVIGPLPMPDDPGMGPMHRLPRLQWKTWVRLALIPAGGDWRDLEKIAPEQYRLEYIPRGGGPFGVQEWNKPAATVTGSSRATRSNGAACEADPRLPKRDTRHPAVYQVLKFDEPSPCVTGTRFGNGAPAIADPRTCHARNGVYGVMAWDKPATTVIGSADVHAGTSAVADPRIPDDYEQGVWVIIALDGTWHRPLTTLELAVLQGFPAILPDGNPLVLAGRSNARWRERIGNAVPPPAAKAIAAQILNALLVSSENDWVLGNTGLWV